MRRTERACPFCGVALALGAAPARVIGERLGRAALFTLGTAVATSAVGCGARSSLLDPQPALARDAATSPVDAAIAAIDAAAIAEDAGAPITHYGAPPPADAFVAEDAGPVVNLYGAPPEPEGDAGVDADLGCCNADYGTPPFF